MDQSFSAIYEHRVLRPLEPVNLNEDEIVRLTVTRPSESALEVSSFDEQLALRQREVLLAFIAKMESRPCEEIADGLSSRDHDRFI